MVLLAWQSKILLAVQRAAVPTETAALTLPLSSAHEVAEPVTVRVLASFWSRTLHWAFRGAVSPLALAAYQ